MKKRLSPEQTEKLADLFDEMAEMMTKPVKLLPRSGDWISCRKARDLYIRAGAMPRDAEKAILRRALHYWPCKVDVFSRFEKPHHYIPMSDRHHFKPDLSHFSEVLSYQAWTEANAAFEAIAGFEPFICPNGVEYADWVAGDFKVTIERDFSDVTLEIQGLQFDRRCLERAIGEGESDVAIRLTEEATRKWIEQCNLGNIKAAWAAMRQEFGDCAPKKNEVFEPLWRELTGNRGRGRPKNPGSNP